MSLPLAVVRGSQTPRVANYPPYPFTAAPEAIDIAAHAGLILDEWQRYVLTHGMGHNADESWTARKVSVWVPRQNGKGGIIEALELFWLFVEGSELIVHTAHQNRTATKAYKRMERLISLTPDLRAQVRQFRMSNGEHQIELRDGRLLQYSTRSDTATRGFSTPRLILDEAQELTSDQNAAIMPTLSAMPNYQAWFFGTPPDDPRAWVYGLKEDGEAGEPRIAHFDWGADLDLEDPDDLEKAYRLETAYATNPALGGRITEETVIDEQKPSGLGDKYPRERLGVWLPRARGGSGVISEDLWNGQKAPEVERPTDVILTVVVNHRRTHTAIVAVGAREDGGLLGSIVDYRPGTAWVVGRIVQLKEDWNPLLIVAQDKGPTGSLFEEFKRAGIESTEERETPERGSLIVPWSDDVADAYGMFIDALNEHRWWHLDEAPMSLAALNSRTRTLSGGTAWDYRGDPDPAPVIGATLGTWGFLVYADRVTDDYDLLDSVY
jgi:hypothetical protein